MTPGGAADQLIVALDCDAEEALALAHAIRGHVRWLKVGMTLYYEQGPAIVTSLRDLGFDVFVDLKLHDIGHQVRGAAARLAALGVQMLTVHASGGGRMIAEAVSGAREGASLAGVAAPAVVAVTVLTSLSDEDLRAIGIARAAGAHAALLAGEARDHGADGVVCSPHEAAAMRELLGEEALIVTPGVRPLGSALGDQSRVMTPAEAIAAGASHLVVGRPITSARVPAEAADAVIAEMEGAGL